MRRVPVPMLLGLVLLGLSATAVSQDVYQWKDANGVTHFSQTPPDKGQYQQRAITQQGATQPQAARVASTPESPQCAAARLNLEVLKGSGSVHETGADGKPGRALSDAERASQTDLANAAIRAYCPPAG